MKAVLISAAIIAVALGTTAAAFALGPVLGLRMTLILLGIGFIFFGYLALQPKAVLALSASFGTHSRIGAFVLMGFYDAFFVRQEERKITGAERFIGWSFGIGLGVSLLLTSFLPYRIILIILGCYLSGPVDAGSTICGV